MHTILKTAWRRMLEVLFPSTCLNCRQYLPSNETPRAICEKCFEKISIRELLTGEKLWAVCTYADTAVKALVHGLKFKRFTNTLPDIKRLISLFLGNNHLALSADYDLITFIPLHPRRERMRGFNQARLIAEIPSEMLQLPLHPTLRRLRDTKEQSSIKDYAARLKNVNDCFVPLVGQATIKDMNIILVDDVYTSGATVREAQKILETLGAKKVTVFVLAKAG